ncbi:hypothetical protein ACFYMW_31345 [Streptomyces sp. NPDC006692]
MESSLAGAEQSGFRPQEEAPEGGGQTMHVQLASGEKVEVPLGGLHRRE